MSKADYKYEFIIKGHISKRHLTEFDKLNLIHLVGGNTKLLGRIIDQAQLYSIINKFSDLGLELLMVKREDIGGDEN